MNIKIHGLHIHKGHLETIHPKAFWTSQSNKLTSHTELKLLNLNDNKIKYITRETFDPLINLETLDLRGNKLSYIDNNFIIHFNKLKYFYIGYNELTQLPTRWLPSSLEHLDISENKIYYLYFNTFEGALNLNKLSLSLNNITIEYNTFSKLSKLTNIEVYPSELEICTCKYIWYINSKINTRVCDNSNNNYTRTREYLKEECNENILG